ncbi:MAG: class I SAM-dependent rRNA methyltransferase [Lachnospiraceae bacterium]|nr:class I SAM-dependent rRNA methyltransferase [Lachnospiraceae bacterium]
MKDITIKLKKGEGRTISAGGAWVFDNEIEFLDTPSYTGVYKTGIIENGSLVKVRAFNDYPLGVGIISETSKIRIRLLSRDIDAVIDDEFFRTRLSNAWEYRKNTVDTSSCRLVFGEADFLPGITIDKFEDVLVIEVLFFGMEQYKTRIIDILKEVLAADGINIRGVYERSDSKERLKEGLERVKGFIGPEFDTTVTIVENGVKYYVDVKDGQKTGFFLDQKYNRLATQRLCKGKKVLDCFTHTGSFALNAGIAGAVSVLGVDASEAAVEMATRNAELNGLSDRVKFEAHDVFELLPELERKGEDYDVVVLDPPAFTKSRDSIKNATKGYKEINIRGMRLVRDGGFLCTCSCSHFMNFELFTKMLHDAARDAGVTLRQVEFRTQSPDHPILFNHDESYYLKFYIFQVVKRK